MSDKYKIEIKNLINTVHNAKEILKKWCFDPRQLDKKFKITMFNDNVRNLDRSLYQIWTNHHFT